MGPAIGETARRLGKPFMPWQQYVADVIGEIDPKTGRLAYSEWGLTVPRQSGKSTFVLAKAVHRCSATKFFGPRQKVVYTAQTRQKAREKWEEDYAAELEASASFKSRVSVHKGNGNEHIRFINGSRFGIEATTEKAGHGGTLDEAYIDEAFAQVDGRLEQAFGPAMITRVLKQLAWISTAGWSDGSPYLQGKVAAGRRQVGSDKRSGLAYFEWSAPEDADVSDRDVWRACMPALGHTITEDAIAAELDKAILEDKLHDFRRAYLNLWVPRSTRTDEGLPGWPSLIDHAGERPRNPSFGLATAPDRSWSAIAVAWRRQDGNAHVQLADYKRTTAWVEDRAAELLGQWGGALHVDTASRGLVDGANELSAPEQARAHNALSDLVVKSKVRHSGDEALDIAARAFQWRLSGDTRVMDRKSSTDISPLVAAALAVWGIDDEGVQFW